MILAEYLQKYHLGKHQAIVSRNLKTFGNGVCIREAVHALRVAGVPICSGNKGYWFAEDLSEIVDTLKSLSSRVEQIEEAHYGLRETYYEHTCCSEGEDDC